MNKEEKELKKYVDKYFDKYMCVSFKKFLENWEETTSLLNYFESKQNKLQQRIDKAIEYIKSYNLPDDLKGMGEAPITLNDLKVLLEILRGNYNGNVN